MDGILRESRSGRFQSHGSTVGYEGDVIGLNAGGLLSFMSLRLEKEKRGKGMKENYLQKPIITKLTPGKCLVF